MEKSLFDKLAVVELRNRTTSTTKLSIRDKMISLSYIAHDREAVKLAIGKYKGRVLDLAYCNNKIYVLTNSSLYAYDIVTASVKSIKAPVDAYLVDVTPAGSNIIVVTTTTGGRSFYTTDLTDFPFTKKEVIDIISKDFLRIRTIDSFKVGVSTCGHLYIGVDYPTRLMSPDINRHGYVVSDVELHQVEPAIIVTRTTITGTKLEYARFNLFK